MFCFCPKKQKSAVPSVTLPSRLSPLQVLITNLTRGHVYEIRVEGVTRSRMTRDRIYQGELSASRKVSDRPVWPPVTSLTPPLRLRVGGTNAE